MTGIAILALGIWTKVDLYKYMELSAIYYKDSPWILIAVGALIVIVGSFGCCCTFKGNVMLLYLVISPFYHNQLMKDQNTWDIYIYIWLEFFNTINPSPVTAVLFFCMVKWHNLVKFCPAREQYRVFLLTNLIHIWKYFCCFKTKSTWCYIYCLLLQE